MDAKLSSMLVAGQRFRGYLVEGEASRGGMGVVYRARDATLGRPVALKVLPPEESGGPEEMQRLLREARLAAALAHPSIVVVHEAGTENGVAFVAMEWVDGIRLDAIVHDDRFPLERRLGILEEVAQALAFAHARSVIHRDIKPSNVMLDTHGRVKLLDFGLARRMAGMPMPNAGVTGGPAFATRAGVIMGTPRYMAPEQMIGAMVDGRADQFAWGVLAYEILGRVHPREAVPTGAGEFPAARPQPLSWRRPEVNEAIAAVVARAIAYDPNARFSSMDELLASWRAARSMTGAAPSHPSAITVPPAMQPSSIVVGPSPYAPTQAVPPAPSRWWIWALASGTLIALLLGGAAVTLYVVSQSEPGSAPAAPAIPGLGASGKIRIESGLESVPFAAAKPDVKKAQTALEGRLAGCFGGSSHREHMFTADVVIAVDGRITSVSEEMVCQETSTPTHYLCTDRGQAKPKPKHPEAAESVFACIDRTLRATKLPPLKAAEPEKTTIHIDFKG